MRARHVEEISPGGPGSGPPGENIVFDGSDVTPPAHRLLRADDLVGDAVAAVEPGDDLAGAGVVAGPVPLAQRRLSLAQPVEPDVLEDQEVFVQPGPQLLTQHRDRGSPGGVEVLVLV